MPEISVVIPTYKRPDLLSSCLMHLEQQTIEKHLFEVIVVSDGEDTLTAEVVQAFQNLSQLNIRYLNTQGKKGPAAARNVGWQSASKNVQLIAFTDDDCQPDKDWLSSFYDRFEPGTAIAYSGFTLVPIEEEPTDYALNTHGLQFADFITANCAISIQALKLSGGFDERYETAWREDSDLEFTLEKIKVPIVKVNEAVVVHPVRENVPWGVSIKEHKKGQFDALLYKKFPDQYRNRLSPDIIYPYYFIVLTDFICLIALLSGWWYIAAVTFLVVFIMISALFRKRIKRTRKTLSHIWEMWVTSMVLPFVSVYWRIYGSIKFRVLFI
jgi:glycosyltransferase involved in cell wall biosynthesis